MSLALVKKKGYPPNKAYCRTSSPAREHLENLYMSMYASASVKKQLGRLGCCIAPSGMAAISALMHGRALKKPNGTFVLGNELYCDVRRTVNYLQRAFPNLKCEYVDVRDTEELLRIFQEHGDAVSLFYIESCTNPSGQMFQFNLLKQLKRFAPHMIFCVDNTWLTSAIFNPLDVGADLVLESLSKYNSAGKCIGGMLVGRRRATSEAREWIRIFGQFVAADHCDLFSNASKTLAQRVSVASKLALAVAQFLEKTYPNQVQVLYPKLPSHPTHHVYLQHVGEHSLGPACFWLHIESSCSCDDLQNILKSNPLPLETSFGSAETKLDPWPRLGLSTDYDFQPSGKGRQGAWIRLALGYQSKFEAVKENLTILINDLISIK